MGLSSEQLNEFRELLADKAQTLLSGSEHTIDGMHSTNTLFADPVDRAALESTRNFTLRLRDRERKLVKKIQEAINRIDNGSFGYCEECDEQIERERLLARPVTTLCIDCKEEQERIEKMEL